ncbi:MAG: prepilin-type N-terminal cleavage/methylation domain-containing protein [Candidatus Muiribacteriota bacterium]
MFIRKKRGFTLIELMIVIAIIGILGGMALPRFARAREQAKQKTCWGNSRNIESAVEMWNMENRDPGKQIKGSNTKISDAQQKDLSDYLSGSKFPFCPDAGEYMYDDKEGVYCSTHGSAAKEQGGSGSGS